MYGEPETRSSGGRGLTIGSFVCAVVAVFFFPIILGPVGIGLGIAGYRKGDPLGRTAAIVSAIGMVGGFILGAIVLSNRA
jgi:hypothetical protein